MSADVVRDRILALLETLSKVPVPVGRVNDLDGLNEMLLNTRTSDIQLLAGHLRQTGLAPEADLFEKLYGDISWHVVGEGLRDTEGAKREHYESFLGRLPQSTGDELRDREDTEFRLALVVADVLELRGLADNLRSHFIAHGTENAAERGTTISTGTKKAKAGQATEIQPRQRSKNCREMSLQTVQRGGEGRGPIISRCAGGSGPRPQAPIEIARATIE
jgi:hypothetical protein